MLVENKKASFPKQDIFYLLVFVPIVILINIPFFCNFKQYLDASLPAYIWIFLAIIINLAFLGAVLYIFYEIYIFLYPEANTIKSIDIKKEGIHIKYSRLLKEMFLSFENIEKIYFEVKMVQFTTFNKGFISKGIPLEQKHEPMPEDCNIRIFTSDGSLYEVKKNFYLGITQIDNDSFFDEIKTLKEKLGSDKCSISFIDTMGHEIDRW